MFLCPYFGKLPSYFPLWLKSCEFNKDINWLLITDDKREFNYPENVTVLYMKFEDLRQYIQNKFKFEINLKTPYKLCDFKPAYGYIFKEKIENHDFWGHCDLDCIFGNIRKFITNEVLNKYEKILFLGHMTIYKNTKEVNNRFMTPLENTITFKDILSSDYSYAFDEFNSQININRIYEFLKIPIYKKNIYADISCMSYDFILSKYNSKFKQYYEKKRKQVFYWRKGKLYRFYIDRNNIMEEEYAYVHFQKRKMINKINNLDTSISFFVVPNKFISNNLRLAKSTIENYSRKKIFYGVYFNQKFKAFRWRINNIFQRL